MIYELFARWFLIGALAFGGGYTALSLVERNMVTETGWIAPTDFGSAIAFAFATPGPVLIMAPFIGYHVAGLGGAVASTAGVFMVPWFLAAASARLLRDAGRNPRLRSFARGATPAVMALLVLTAVELGRASYAGSPTLLLIAGAAVAAHLRVHPLAVLAVGAAFGLALHQR